MNTILELSITVAQVMLGLAMVASTIRLFLGPRAQDRVVGFDALYISGMLIVLTQGIRTGSAIFFEAALIIALLGFVSTVSLAKFLLRGEAIE